MNKNCGIVQDLLPLFSDGLTGEESNAFIREHLKTCPSCSASLDALKSDETEKILRNETSGIIESQKKYFKRKSAVAGTVIAGILCVPILVCLIVNLAVGRGLDWFFIVLLSLALFSSFTVLPLLIPKNKAFFTFVSFVFCLEALLGVCAIYSGGKWFPVAASSSLFGICLCFLPFVLKTKLLSSFFGRFSSLFALSLDTLLYVFMMLCIGKEAESADYYRIAFGISLPFITLVWLIFLAAKLRAGIRTKAGLIVLVSGAFTFFADHLINRLIGNNFPLPAFDPFVWNYSTLSDNLLYLILFFSLFVSLVLIVPDIIKHRKDKNK